jgi:hypothetical protein
VSRRISSVGSLSPNLKLPRRPCRYGCICAGGLGEGVGRRENAAKQEQHSAAGREQQWPCGQKEDKAARFKIRQSSSFGQKIRHLRDDRLSLGNLVGMIMRTFRKRPLLNASYRPPLEERLPQTRPRRPDRPSSGGTSLDFSNKCCISTPARNTPPGPCRQ